ncbi:MAG: hypothetical protein LIO97_02325 [Tannerellaceae bacterium]|nr:hypothetical protein [Tannerellaceae bacterium]
MMMVSFITLVLIGTSDFENPTMKKILMGAFGVSTICMIILRVLEARQNNGEGNSHH